MQGCTIHKDIVFEHHECPLYEARKERDEWEKETGILATWIYEQDLFHDLLEKGDRKTKIVYELIQDLGYNFVEF